jgi:hypothetical protein
MLMDPMGGIVMTNDGNAILREITVQHPAAKTMIEIARTQVTLDNIVLPILSRYWLFYLACYKIITMSYLTVLILRIELFVSSLKLTNSTISMLKI